MFKWLSFIWMMENVFTLYGGGGKGGSDAPDYSQMAAASEKAAVLGKELGDAQLAENKRQYDMNMTVANPIIGAQTDLMRQQQAQGDDYYNYMKQNSRPIETNLFYEAMGLNADEIAQIEGLRSSEQAAAQEAAAGMARTAATPNFVNLPTQTLKTNLPSGAIKGSDIKGNISLGSSSPLDPRYQQNYGMSAYANQGKGGGAAPRVAADPNSYYAKQPDGSYRVVTPTYETVNGSSMVAVPGQDKPASAASLLNNSGSNALLTKLAAGAGLRQQEEAASSAIADSRNGFTNANNMAIRQGLRYGASPEKIAAMLGAQSAQQAEAQAAAASGARDKAKNVGYAKKLDVAGLYRGLPGASQAAYGLTLNAGNAAVGNQNATSGQYVNGMNAGTNTIMNGQQMKVNGLGQILNAQTSAYNASNSGDGGMAGFGGMLGQLGAAGISKWGGA